jgi:hypothetical protein
VLDTKRLKAFMHRFYGYGSWSAPLWFVGMEEGGGNSLQEVERRLTAWSGGDLEDLREFHRRTGFIRHHEGQVALQSTWAKLIRIALCADDRPADTEAVRQFQQNELGRAGGATTLLELFPLPSPSTRHWTYGDCGIPEIATRDAYRNTLEEPRTTAIRARIDEHAPKAVVFYGMGYRPYWERIAEITIAPVEGERFSSAGRGSTLLLLAPHPVATGVRNDEFCRIGRFLASEVTSSAERGG